KTAADGSFRLAVLPGPGHLLVKGPTSDYLHVETSYRAMELGKPGGQRFYPDAVVALEPRVGSEPGELAIELRRGVTVTGRVAGPDGKPVTNYPLLARSFIPYGVVFRHNVVPAKEGTFELPGCAPDRPTPVLVLDAAGQQGAVVEVAGKQAKDGPLT